jgi:hypothetical protein
MLRSICSNLAIAAALTLRAVSAHNGYKLVTRICLLEFEVGAIPRPPPLLAALPRAARKQYPPDVLTDCLQSCELMVCAAAKPVPQSCERGTSIGKHLLNKLGNPTFFAPLATAASHRTAASHVQVKGKYGKTGRTTQFVATGLSREGASKYMFPFTNKEDGTETQMSVATYFAKQLGIKLAFPHLQCVTVRVATLSLLQLDTGIGCIAVSICLHSFTRLQALASALGSSPDAVP